MKYILRLLDKIFISLSIVYKYIYAESCFMDMKDLILSRSWELGEISISKNHIELIVLLPYGCARMLPPSGNLSSIRLININYFS